MTENEQEELIRTYEIYKRKSIKYYVTLSYYGMSQRKICIHTVEDVYLNMKGILLIIDIK